jgi:hypothetical protein
VGDETAGAEVHGRHEAGQPQILEPRVAEHAFEHRCGGPHRQQRHPRHRELAGNPGCLELAPVAFLHLVGRPTGRDLGGQHGADARPADAVHGHAALRQGAEGTRVGETARPASAKHQPDAPAEKVTREPRLVRGRAGPDVMMAAEPAERQPGRRS